MSALLMATQQAVGRASDGGAAIPGIGEALCSWILEKNPAIQIQALKLMNEHVDIHWMEFSDALPEIEGLFEDDDFPERGLAALIASKIYFYLGAPVEALKFALEAGDFLHLENDSLYERYIIAECFEQYISYRNFMYERQLETQGDAKPLIEDTSEIDERLRLAIDNVASKMLMACARSSQVMDAICLSLDAKNLSLAEKVINAAENRCSILHFISANIDVLIDHHHFRTEVLHMLTRAYMEEHEKIKAGGNYTEVEICDIYNHLTRCQMNLKQHEDVAEKLSWLLTTSHIAALSEPFLVAFQIAFDISEHENQAFQQAILASPQLAYPDEIRNVEQSTSEQTEASTTTTTPIISESDLRQKALTSDVVQYRKLALLRYILSGDARVDFLRKFLQRSNNTDLPMLDAFKGWLDTRSSMLHHGLVIAHGFMQCRTGADTFLRRNLDWMARATCWARFSATASLGVIHQGHISESLTLLRTYLPASIFGGSSGNSGSGASAYSKGGSLYALGLIHCGRGDANIRSILLQQVQEPVIAEEREATPHGAALGLGLACMGAASDTESYEALKTQLYTDSAVTGEGAALAMGLVGMGSGMPVGLRDLLAYAHETQHEKIARACSIGIALMVYRVEEQANALLEDMLKDSQAFIRYGGVLAIGMAFCGSEKRYAVEKLLRTAVGDMSVDVRRSAVISLGFVLCKNPDQLCKILKLLCCSFTPHVRYGCALAIGIGCGGTAHPEAIGMLKTLCSDSSDFVRQGAYLGLALVLQQASVVCCPDVAWFRQTLESAIKDKHEHALPRMGALIAAGILEAGGRNVCARLVTDSGVIRMEAVAGIFLFSQFWYWYPLVHMLSLAYMPTALVGLVANISEVYTDTAEVTSQVKPESANDGNQMEDIKKEDLDSSNSNQESGEQKMEVKLEKAKVQKERAVLSCPLGWQLQCVCEDGLCKYPDPISSNTNKPGQTTDVKKAILSTSKKHQQKQQQKHGNDAMDVDATGNQKTATSSDTKATTTTTTTTTDRSAAKADSKPAASKKTPVDISNPCRVIGKQQEFIRHKGDSRYVPLCANRVSGFVILRDVQRDAKEEYITFPELPTKAPEAPEEPAPFEPFSWNG